MASEKQLRNVLIEVFEHLQAQRNALSMLLTEVGAIRESLIELAPQYDPIVNRHRAHHRESNTEPLAEALAKYQQIIQRLRDDDLG
jgi:hypothetical protein